MERSPQPSPVWKPYAEAARALGFRLTEAALRPGRSGSRIDDLARRLQKELDQMMQLAFDALPGGGEPACAPGCDHCCRTLRVTVSPIEVFVIIHRLRESHHPDPALEARLVAPRHGELQPCPLLAGGVCLVYSSRPLACRGCVSGDASLCAACDDSRPVPRSTAHQLGAAAMMKGVTEALDALGLAGRPIELREGLASAVHEEDAEKRWLRGEDVFSDLV
ncbi:MAG: YkgJ family cysteine cluster protein [Thermoleophilia bacterium]|nr:YkgJ family cysteine cluster protein [Thermoleophilia bacterium]